MYDRKYEKFKIRSDHCASPTLDHDHLSQDHRQPQQTMNLSILQIKSIKRISEAQIQSRPLRFTPTRMRKENVLKVNLIGILFSYGYFFYF